MASKREKVRMQSTESHHYFTTTKNKRTTPDKLEFKRYDPVVRRHVLYKEAKLAKAS